MDRQLLERMIGAAVLIVALIVIVPAVLDGPDRTGEPGSADVERARDAQLKTVTISADRNGETPPVPTAAARPEPPASKPQVRREPQPAESRPAPAPPADQALADAAAAAKTIKPAAGGAAAGGAAAGSAGHEAPAPEKAETKAKPEDPPAVEARSVQSGWAVQLGSFASRDNAERLVAQVAKKGFEAYLVPFRNAGKSMYRVRVGPEASRDEAAALAARLKSAGYKGQVTRQEATS